MVKDTLLRIVFIPLLAFTISAVSGIITHALYSTPELIGALLYFIFVSFAIWQGCQWIHLKLRHLHIGNQNPYYKVGFVCLVSGLYGICVSGILGLTWLSISKEDFSWNDLFKFILFSVLAVIVFTLLYEVLYLSKEREQDQRIVSELDQELTRTEMIALRNEMDPHFIFNSLATLSYLIKYNNTKADQFNERLTEVYRYFLKNKEKELIPLADEIQFIRNYFFLLRIRHGDKLKFELPVGLAAMQTYFIVPCALQILVENALKHNSYTAEQPLTITMSREGEYIAVQNARKPKSMIVESTGIGLRNLDAQYQLLCGKGLAKEITDAHFKVLLPLVKKKEQHQASGQVEK